MDMQTFQAASPPAGTGEGLSHLSGPSAAIRQVVAAHFLRDCPHIVEIGGYLTPVTDYLTHQPQSVLSVDPKTEPYEADELNGHPCHVRHVARKFQDVSYDYAPRSYGLVLLGYSLKPFGRREPLGQLLFSLIDNAKIVIVDYAPDLDRAASQVPAIIERHTVSVHCSFELLLEDKKIAGSPYAKRRFFVLHPAG